MAYRRILAGSTSQLIEFPIYDSSSTTGALKTGLTYSSMTCSYYIEGASGTVQVTPVSMTMGTWTTKGFIAVDGTNTPGLYQFGIPNAAIAAGATQVTLYFTASGCVPIVIPIELTSVTNYPVNATQWNGTNVSSPATAGIPDVNIKNMNNVAATSITAVNANQGTTQPLNFTGTGSSALVKVDVTDIATAAVATGSAQLGVNLVNIAGSAVSTSSAQLGVNVVTQANIDFGALQKTSLNAATPVASLSGDLTSTMKTSVTTAATAATPTVLLTAGTGTGQLDFTSGVVKASLVQILGTALTETTGYLAAAFKAFFNIASPVLTTASVNQTGDSYNIVKSGGTGDNAAIKTQTDKLAFTVANKIDANVYDWNGTAVHSPGTAGIPDVNAVNWAGGTIPAPNVAGVPKTDPSYLLGTAWLAPGTAGTPDVNAKLVGGNVPGSATIGTVTNLTNAPTSGDLTSTMKTSVENAVWEATAASHENAGTTGLELHSAGSAGDPWSTGLPGSYGAGTAGEILGNLSAGADPWAIVLPGAYGAGTAGKIVGTNLDTTVTSRLATSAYTAPDNADITLIKAKTDNLPASPAAVGSNMGTVTSVTGAVGSVTAAVTVGTNNDKTGYSLSSAGVQAIWDALTSALTTVGSIGKLLVTNINAALSSLSTYAGGDTPGTTTLLSRIVGTLLTGNHNPQSGDSYARLGAPVHASISADIAAIGAATDPWLTALPGSYGAGTAGNILGSNLNATVGSRATQTSVNAIPTTPLLAANYTAPDNADIATIKSDVENVTYGMSAIHSQIAAGVPVSGDLTSTMKTSVADAVLDATTSSHNTPGSIGGVLASVGASVDPWTVSLPGTYVPGSAGDIIGNQLPATYAQSAFARKTQTNKAVISPDQSLVTIYDDDLTTILLQFAISPGDLSRTPLP
jgi:hypothetical protein